MPHSRLTTGDIGQLPDLEPTWAQRWNPRSSHTWGVAWVHLIQALAAADAGSTGLAARTAASGLRIEVARSLEADWAMIAGVVWREDAPPTWPEEAGLESLLVPPPPEPWGTWRERWQSAVADGWRFTAAWGMLQWALRVVRPGDQRLYRVDDLRSILGWSGGTIRRAAGELDTVGLLTRQYPTAGRVAAAWPGMGRRDPISVGTGQDPEQRSGPSRDLSTIESLKLILDEAIPRGVGVHIELSPNGKIRIDVSPGSS